MLYTLYDLPGALRLCHRLVTDFDRVSCSGGVFMENQQSSYGITSPWLKKDDLLYPCGIVSQSDKTYCYLLATSQILPRVGWDWKKTADWCRKSEKGFVGLCFQSYGRDASGNSLQDPAKARDLCANAGSGEEECIFGAVRDILNTDPSDLGAARLCQLAKPAHRPYCAYGIGSIVAVNAQLGGSEAGGLPAVPGRPVLRGLPARRERLGGFAGISLGARARCLFSGKDAGSARIE